MPVSSVPDLNNNQNSDQVPNRSVSSFVSVPHTFTRPLDTMVSTTMTPNYIIELNAVQMSTLQINLQVPSSDFVSWPRPSWSFFYGYPSNTFKQPTSASPSASVPSNILRCSEAVTPTVDLSQQVVVS